MNKANDILDHISALKEKGERFALATVVRTVAATAAKAGAKAIILPDGSVSGGWIGGGCARAAVVKAAHESLADGKARLVSVEPPDVLQAKGISAGEEREGVRFAKNMCPSKGTMDIFVEPVLPRPEIVLCGSSPVAQALADLGRRLGFSITACAPGEEQAAFGDVDRRIEGYTLPVESAGVALRRRLDAGAGRRGGASRRACRRGRLCRLRRQRQEGGEAARQACRGGRRPDGAGEAEVAGGPRSRRHHAGGDRAFDPCRDRGAPPLAAGFSAGRTPDLTVPARRRRGRKSHDGASPRAACRLLRVPCQQISHGP